MISPTLCLYDQYKIEYENFVKNKGKFKYESKAQRVEYKSSVASLLYYESTVKNASEIFLIVPSIFNSPEIFFLSKKNNFIDNLLLSNDVYMINWQDHDKRIVIEDLVCEVEKIIIYLATKHKKKINLIGHCIGGNFCIAVAQNNFRNYLNSLSLLTVPWDFTHLTKYVQAQEILGFRGIIKNINTVPRLYIRMMFFLMFPMQFKDKINKYFKLSAESKKFFLEIECWLQSGISISKSLYEEIIDNFCLYNASFEKKWSVNNEIVDLKNIGVPTCIVHALEDQIVPYSSIIPLRREIKNAALIKVKGGHINYLINPQPAFQKEYSDWLREAGKG